MLLLVLASGVGGWLFASVPAARPAIADDPTEYGYQGGNDGIRVPDGREHRYCFTASVPASQRPHIQAAMSNLDLQTVMWDVFEPSCHTTTDVVWRVVDGIYPSGVLAAAICEAHVAWGVCDRYRADVEATRHFLVAVGGGGACRHPGTAAFNACVSWEYQVNLSFSYRHELGHTAGLHHAEPPLWPYWRAMSSGWVPQGQAYQTFHQYNAFHVNLINANV